MCRYTVPQIGGRNLEGPPAERTGVEGWHYQLLWGGWSQSRSRWNVGDASEVGRQIRRSELGRWVRRLWRECAQEHKILQCFVQYQTLANVVIHWRIVPDRGWYNGGSRIFFFRGGHWTWGDGHVTVSGIMMGLYQPTRPMGSWASNNFDILYAILCKYKRYLVHFGSSNVNKVNNNRKYKKMMTGW